MGESDQSLSGIPGTSTDIRLSQGTSGRRIVTRSFQCSDDGYIGVHTGAVGAFGRLMKVLGLDDRIPSSESGMDMAELLDPDQQALLINESVAIFATQPRDYWVEKLLEADVCGIEHLRQASRSINLKCGTTGWSWKSTIHTLGAFNRLEPP